MHHFPFFRLILLLAAFSILGALASAQGDDAPPPALFVLLKDPAPLTTEIVESVRDAAWGPVAEDGSEERFVVPTGESGMFIIRDGDWMAQYNQFGSPLLQIPEADRAQIPPDLLAAFDSHTAFRAMYIMTWPDDAGFEDVLAKLAELHHAHASVAPGTVVGLYSPMSDAFFAGEPLSTFLASDDPAAAIRELMGLPPLVRVSADDPRMIAAEEEARSRFPEFIEAWHARDGETAKFAVKVRITEGETTELPWMVVLGIDEEGSIHGRISNTPRYLTSLKMNDTYKASADQIADWAIAQPDGSFEGAFSMKVLESINDSSDDHESSGE